MAHRIDAAVTRVRTVGDNLEFNYKDGTKLEIGSDGSGTIHYNNGNSEKLSKTQILQLQQAASVYLVDEKYYGYNDYDSEEVRAGLDNIENFSKNGVIDTKLLSKNIGDTLKNDPYNIICTKYKQVIATLSDKIDKNGCIDTETFKQVNRSGFNPTKTLGFNFVQKLVGWAYLPNNNFCVQLCAKGCKK